MDRYRFMLDHALYCALCGSPLSPDAFADAIPYHEELFMPDGEGGIMHLSVPSTVTPDGMKWLADFKLMSPAHSSMDDSKLSPSHFLPGSAYCDRRVGTVIGVDIVPVYDHDAQTGLACLPMYAACVAIAERVFERRKRQGPGHACGGERGPKPTSLEGLYDSVNRQSRNGESPGRVACAVSWPHGCYGAQAYQGAVWTWKPDDANKWLCMGPIKVPGLTAFILAHLQPVTEKENDDDNDNDNDAAGASNRPSPSPASPPSALERLPVELLDHTTSYLAFADTLALARTSDRLHRRLLTQRWWRNALIAGDAVGYLWDLDPAQCRAKDAMAAGQPWDWRALARQLAARDCFDDGGRAGFKDAPAGLRNRQRIWKILVDV
ncbi:MAG: hypothetical protein M1826_000907 [Phylliscum demangeonii]|nr:MAG: hypothetical protein M1826_000907 [Phylliscum demangeonii]